MKPIFSRNVDVDKIAFLNWRTSKYSYIQNMYVLAEGYMSSALILAKKCLDNNDDKKGDMLIFPILNNANHAIELYLKAILWTLNKIIKNNAKIEGGHNIKQIYETVKSRIREYPGQVSVSDFNKQTKVLKLYIDELFKIIKAIPKNDKMDFARYPFSKNYENHFYVEALGNVEVDLENFVSQFKLISDSLEDLADFLFFQELNEEW